MLVEERVNPRVVMDDGDWDTYQSIKPSSENLARRTSLESSSTSAEIDQI